MINEKIFLIGPMGAGKTTIGKYLAEILGLPFIDTDQIIEDRTGADIPWIFDVEGEEGFRAREAKVVDEVCDSSPAVIATGGGVVMRDDNRSRIAESGLVVYLAASVNQQLERTGKDKSRPLLNAGDPETVIRELMEVREPLYMEMADVVRQSDNKNPKSAAQDIARKIQDLRDN